MGSILRFFFLIPVDALRGHSARVQAISAFVLRYAWTQLKHFGTVTSQMWYGRTIHAMGQYSEAYTCWRQNHCIVFTLKECPGCLNRLKVSLFEPKSLIPILRSSALLRAALSARGLCEATRTLR